MKCKDAEKMIPAFLNDELEGLELKKFIEHVDSCPECMEELTIQLLVMEGLERLESGNNFNLMNALSRKLAAARSGVKLNHTLKHTLIWLELAVAALIIIALVILL